MARLFVRSQVTALLTVAMVWGWVLLAPGQFGGQASFVMVAGASMEPALHQGDLVIVRQAQVYQVGDVAAYHHPLVGPVIHRITDREGPRFVLKGDNNAWLDSHSPTAAEIIGKSWLVIPGAARLLTQLRSPAGLALLSLAFGLILVFTIRNGDSSMKSRRTQRRRRIPAQAGTISRSEAIDGALLALGATTLASCLLVLAAFGRPASIEVPDDIPYQHTAAFAYHAGAPASVYAGGELRSGDPIFDQLVPRVRVEFSYALQTDESAAVGGTYELQLEVSEPNGWHRTVVLAPERAFAGTSFQTSATVDLTLVRQMITLMETRTSVARPTYAVAVAPIVHVQGLVGTAPINETFSPVLSFQMDPAELYLNRGVGLGEADSDPLRPSQDGFLPRVKQIPATLTILGLDIPIPAARWIGATGLILSIAGLAYLLIPILLAYRKGGLAQLLAKHGPLLVEVRDLPLGEVGLIIEAASLDDVAKLAEKDARMILHVIRDRDHHFYVQDGETTYHTMASGDPQGGEA